MLTIDCGFIKIDLNMAEPDVSFLEEDERSEEAFRRQLRKEQRSMIHDLQSE